MPRRFFPFLVALLPLIAQADVTISEIMYHPQSENPAEEYIELYNPSASAVDVSGWKFSNGVQFTFPASTSIAPGGYLVVTSNPMAFHAKYPAVANYLATAGWVGQLSNSSNRVRLDDALGTKRDEVTYADDGDWGMRTKDTVADYNHKGWDWRCDADGFGKSLELINSALDNGLGQNWAPSATVNGTPGTANSIAVANVAPFIEGVTQFPFVPTHTDEVAITAQIVAATLTGVSVTVHYRNDGAANFTTATMFDDGLHGDALAGDGIYGALLPAAANLTIVEFFVQAVDAGSRSRTWPAPAFDDNLATGKTGQFCNALYQVDDTVYAGAMPYYKIVMKAADKAELTTINTTGADAYSHAKMNATWITRDGTGTELRYLCGVRNRGHGSSSKQPQSYSITFPNDHTWKSLTSLNLNTQHTHAQLFGSALFRAAGLTCPESRQAQVRVNGVDPTGGTQVSPSWGFYCANEVQNSEFADHHFPNDSSGNIYRSQRLDSNAQQGDFSYIDNNPVSYQPVWFKHTNTSENKWTDLINLCFALSKGHSDANFNTTYDAGYEAGVQALADVREWMRFFAVNAIVDNSETNLYNGYGDDFYIYFGVTDPRCKLIPYDLDTICGQGDSVPTPTQHGLFRMVNKDDASGNGPTVMNSFIKNPTFAPIYYDELNKQLNGVFNTATFNALVDQILTGVVPAARLTSIKTFQTARTPYLASLIPLTITVTNTQTVAGAALPTYNGYTVSIAPNASTTPASVTNADPSHCKLIGKANAITTRSVKVNGVIATWSAWQATWTASSVTLSPGINRILIQSLDENGVETERSTQDIWYEDGSVATKSGTGVTETWTAAGGPYQITANYTVPSGVTLTIQPGSSVYLNSGVTMTVAAGGRILAEGTAGQPIRFTRAPGLATNGGTITINGQAGAPESHFYNTYFEFGGNPAVVCTANSNVIFDHCEWLRNDVAYLHLDGGSFIVSNCIFPASAPGKSFEGVHGTNAAPPAGGRAIIRDCYFGKISSVAGSSDVVDFTGGNRPNPIIQFYNNVFVGSDDDVLDLDGTDAWVEGNIFMHIHRLNSPDSSSAISGGNDAGGNGGGHEVSAIDTATDNLTFGSAHGFTTGQEVTASKILGNTFPPATPALHNGGPYFVRVVSTTVVKLYPTAADASADTNAINFTGGLSTGVNLNVHKLDGVSHITMVGNLFYDLDQCATAKQGNFYTFLNNTVINQNNAGSQDSVTAVLNFADDNYLESAGMYVEGNIIQSAKALARNYGSGLAQTVIYNNNLFPPGMTWSGAGSGNLSADARLNDTTIPTPGPYDYQRVAAQIRQKFGLQAGSPARGTGPNGSDKGGVRPIGVSIGGAPSGTTNLTNATLIVGTRMTGNGIPSGSGAWPNGSGWTHYKWRLDGGAWSAETPISTPISLSGLANGTHTVEVAGKNDAGTYQDSLDLGPSARVSSATWTVNTGYIPPVAGVLINEVLVKNVETLGFSGTFPDICELYNSGGASADLSGWGLTDNSSLPYKYTFPAGTTLGSGQYLVVYLSNSVSVPLPRTGFALKDTGDTLTLTKSPAAGGTVADSIPFGAQLPDYSVGRRATDGGWDMCLPTFGAANIVAAQENPNKLLINEWLADAQLLANTDFIEIYNPSSLPVNIGNCFLTDNPVENITVSPLRQLTFVSPGGYVSFKADNDPSQGADHLAFKLTPNQGEIGFFDASQNLIDRIIYGPQSTDVSQGRTPNGSSIIAFFNQPTPGGPNPGSTGGSTTTVSLVPATQTWKYYPGITAAPPADANGRTYEKTAFVDTSWTSGQQLLYIETAALTNAEGFTKTTVLPGLTTTKPYQTYYFRTHFTYGGSLSGVTLTLKTMVDDGCIIYLNGTELIPTSGSRIGMNTGAVVWATLANRSVGDAAMETFTVPSSALLVGDNVLAVEVHQVDLQSSGTTSSDVVWGMKLDATVTVADATAPVVVNEVLANNVALQNPDGSFTGWIELYNTSGSAIDVSDMSLTDSSSDARKWIFPAGSSVPANGFLVVFCNPLAAPSASLVANMNTGFGLNSVGDQVFLFKKLTDGGGLQDSVVFGQQVPDRSIGRIANGTGAFTLNTATRGALNSAASLGAISTVKLNEWLANPNVAPGWFELYNSGPSPVLLSGNYLTDNLSNRTKFLIAPLTFIGGTGNSGNSRWLQLIADNDSGATPNHVNFTLDPAGEALGIFSGSGVQLESVSFGTQTIGVSQGRYPDGTSAIVALTPTPGTANVQAAADTDGDGIPDAWETANGLNPGDPNDAALDADGDGQSNYAEYLAGTNPQSGTSRLAAEVVPTGSPGQYAVRFTAIAGKSYTVRYKNALTDMSWTKLADVQPQTVTSVIDVPDGSVIGHSTRFYQVVTPQQP